MPAYGHAQGTGHPLDAVLADAEAVLGELRLGEAELSIVLGDDAFIHPLNRDHRGKDKPTDVLSFSQREGEGADPEDMLLGDIIISVETAARQAEERGHGIAHELRVLIVHGILHLLGHDHEDDDEAEVMEAEERRLLALLAARGEAR